MLVRDGERLAQFARTRTQGTFLAQATPALHRRHAVGRFERADQDSTGAAFLFAYEIQTPVDAIGAVDIDIARGTEHHRVALGASVEGMRGGIGVMIGLEFDDHAADTVDEQRRADQIGRDFEYGTIEKRPAKARGRHGRTLHIPCGLSFRGARMTFPSSWPGLSRPSTS